MAAFGGVSPSGEGVRYAEYSPPSTKRPDADIDRGLVSPAGAPASLRLRAALQQPRGPPLASASPLRTCFPSNPAPGIHSPSLPHR